MYLDLFVSLTAGLLLGIFFFGGLWLTVKKLPVARRPALLALASFLIRTGAVAGGFYLLLTYSAGEAWLNIAGLLAGFIAVRLAAVFLAGRLERFEEAN